MPSSNHHLHELALFAGAGGGILGGKLLGWKCVCAVEFEPAAQRMLAARQDDGCLDPFPIWDDVRTFDGKPWRGLVDVVSGGFPCQDISAAGKGAGLSGERSGLWSEMSRIIGEVGPRYVIVENSPVLTSRGLGTVLGDLASMGYDARWGVLGAVHAGAPHKRERIWIVADSGRSRTGSVGGAAGADRGRNARRNESPLRQAHGAHGSDRPDPTGEAAGDMADAMRERSEAGATNPPRREERDAAKPVNGCDLRHAAGAGLPHWATEPMGEPGTDTESERSDWWATEPDLGRVAHGVAARVDRLRCLGNGQVPAVVELAWKTLKS